jgi:hypothetical protein
MQGFDPFHHKTVDIGVCPVDRVAFLVGFGRRVGLELERDASATDCFEILDRYEGLFEDF